MTRPQSDTDDEHTELDPITEEDAERLLDDPDDDDSDDQDDDTDAATGKPRLKRSDRDIDAARQELLKWRSLARKHEKSSKQQADKLRQYEDANKSEAQRLTDALAEAKTRAEKAEGAVRRREIAEERAPAHATAAQIRAVSKRLTGDSDDDLEADADELFELLAPEPASKPRTPRRPEERLGRPRGGGDPEDDDEETDPRKLADMIRKGR